METTIDELKDLIQKKEEAYKKALDQMEIALISFKNRFEIILQKKIFFVSKFLS
jgi:hypothetical protein